MIGLDRLADLAQVVLAVLALGVFAMPGDDHGPESCRENAEADHDNEFEPGDAGAAKLAILNTPPPCR